MWGDAILDDVDQEPGRFVRLLFDEQKEVSRLLRRFWHQALINAVSVADDEAAGCLTKDRLETDDGGDPGIDQISQDVSRAD